jgi:pimeloyl-ACP methyl ester carboxylesterase
METTEFDGIELEYEVTGSGEPVLLISPVLAGGFLPLVSEPSLEGYQLVRYHTRGWVGSTHTEGPVSVEDHAADAAQLLDHLGVDRVHAAGHSSGAAVAAQLALDDPGRVATLTLMELSIFSVPSGEAFLEGAAPVFDAYGRGEHEAALTMFLSAVSGLDPEACQQLLAERIPGAAEQALKDVDTFFGVELPGLTQWTFEPVARAIAEFLGRHPIAGR